MNPTPPTPSQSPTAKPPGGKAIPQAPIEPPKKPKREFKLNSKSLRWILLVSLGLSALVFLLVFLAGTSFMGKESQKMVGLKVASQAADAQLANLEQAKKQVEKYSYFKQIAQTVIPNDKDQATAIAEINKMANQSAIKLQSITFPASTLGLGLTTGTTNSTSTTQQDASSASKSKAVSQSLPVIGVPGLYSLALTITPESDDKTPPKLVVTYPKILKFLGLIENNRHTAQITDVEISPANVANNDGSILTFSVTTNIFIKP